MLKPQGVVIITTINRSLPALLLAKFALEYIVRLVPAGTHDPQKFVRPAELRAEFAAAGIMLDDITGLAPRASGGFRQTGSLAINYAASGGFT
jgi:2-polyprenyl-6-hydroxyphenyl methylase/3-demethylubiquinone-9 3-methyltransferase